LKYVDAGDCVPILQQTANLVHCHLLLEIGFDSIFPVSSLFNSNITLPSLALPSFALPSLESLTLDAHGHRITKFLDCFIVPALRRLEIPEPFLGSSPIRSLESFISKSGCSLQDVSITGDRTVFAHFYRLAFPSFRSFIFPGTYIGEPANNED
jgi:hypothetical protein